MDELKVSDSPTRAQIYQGMQASQAPPPIQVVPEVDPPHQHPVAAMPVGEVRSVEMVDPQYQQPVAGL